MVVLMCSDLTFCQFFLGRETRKLALGWRVSGKVPLLVQSDLVGAR